MDCLLLFTKNFLFPQRLKPKNIDLLKIKKITALMKFNTENFYISDFLCTFAALKQLL